AGPAAVHPEWARSVEERLDDLEAVRHVQFEEGPEPPADARVNLENAGELLTATRPPVGVGPVVAGRHHASGDWWVGQAALVGLGDEGRFHFAQRPARLEEILGERVLPGGGIDGRGEGLRVRFGGLSAAERLQEPRLSGEVLLVVVVPADALDHVDLLPLGLHPITSAVGTAIVSKKSTRSKASQSLRRASESAGTTTLPHQLNQAPSSDPPQDRSFGSSGGVRPQSSIQSKRTGSSKRVSRAM